MYPFGGILIAPLVAGYFASLVCRVRRRKDRRPSWLTIPFAVAAGVAAAWIATFQTDLFIPARWSASGKVPMVDMLLISGVLSASVGAATAILVVYYYLRQYERTRPMV